MLHCILAQLLFLCFQISFPLLQLLEKSLFVGLEVAYLLTLLLITLPFFLELLSLSLKCLFFDAVLIEFFLKQVIFPYYLVVFLFIFI